MRKISDAILYQRLKPLSKAIEDFQHSEAGESRRKKRQNVFKIATYLIRDFQIPGYWLEQTTKEDVSISDDDPSWTGINWFDNEIEALEQMERLRHNNGDVSYRLVRCSAPIKTIFRSTVSAKEK